MFLSEGHHIRNLLPKIFDTLLFLGEISFQKSSWFLTLLYEKEVYIRKSLDSENLHNRDLFSSIEYLLLLQPECIFYVLNVPVSVPCWSYSEWNGEQ